jgi:mRNA interferase MazF
MIFRQGDLVWMDFDPSLGHEPKNRRSALVVSNNEFNISTSMTLVIPITTYDNGFYLHEPVPEGYSVSGFLVMEQLRAVDMDERNAEKADRLSKKDLAGILALVKSFFEI